MTTAWIKFHLLLRHDSVFLSILLQDMASTLLTTINEVVMLHMKKYARGVSIGITYGLTKKQF